MSCRPSVTCLTVDPKWQKSVRNIRFFHISSIYFGKMGLRALQVFDLQEYRPGPVLKKIWENFAEQERAGDKIAPIIRRHPPCSCGWLQDLRHMLPAWTDAESN